jgi:hypothetical protein
MDAIKINLDAFTIGDMALLMKLGGGNNAALMPEIIDMLGRVVVGGVDHLPAVKFGDVLTQLMNEYSAAANPQTPAG